ncbi:unnamed protein product [Amoebophrya sp. A120]|nr:unnamed protein product [Amoebophrya sp. A120]|eukprot:GSA120T00010442001.1
MLRSTTGRFGGAHPDLSVMRNQRRSTNTGSSATEQSIVTSKPPKTSTSTRPMSARDTSAINYNAPSTNPVVPVLAGANKDRAIHRLQRALGESREKLYRLEGEADRVRKQCLFYEQEIERMKAGSRGYHGNGGDITPPSSDGERTIASKHDSPEILGSNIGTVSQNQMQIRMNQMHFGTPMVQPPPQPLQHSGGNNKQLTTTPTVDQQQKHAATTTPMMTSSKPVFGSEFRPLRVAASPGANPENKLRKPELLFSRATTIAQDSFRKVLGINGSAAGTGDEADNSSRMEAAARTGGA